jgi:apolipoprotein N-acyltransferase
VVAAAVLLAAGWVLIEAVRSWEHLGGPFGLLGSSQWERPWLRAPAAAGGVWAVSFLAVVVNAGVVAAVETGMSWAARGAGAAAAAVALAAGPLTAALLPAPGGAGEVLRVGVVQIGTPMGGVEERFARHEDATRTLAGRDVDVVVWGESSVGADLRTRSDLTARLRALARDLDADLLVNTDARRQGAEGIFKTTVRVTASGVAGSYDKMRLVPFGEHVPLRPVLGWVAEVTDAAEENRRRGTSLVLLDVRGVPVGPLVSFETSFPDLSRTLTRRGAALLVMQSSTASFQESWAPAQLASLAALRATETGRPVVHVATTGVTAAFDARGDRLAWYDTTRRGAWVILVPLESRATPSVRLGDWVPAACALLLVAAALIRVRRRRA